MTSGQNAAMEKSDLSSSTDDDQNAEPDEKWRILLVEDNMDDDMQARRILAKSDRIGKVASCRDAHELFNHINKNHLNDEHKNGPVRTLILLDIHLPGIDGMVLLEQLKTSPLTENIPIVVITGDEDLDRVYQAYKKHANAFVLKPFEECHLKDLHIVFDKGSNWKER